MLFRYFWQTLTLIISPTFIQDQVFFEATWSTLQTIVNQFVDNKRNIIKDFIAFSVVVKNLFFVCPKYTSCKLCKCLKKTTHFI